MQKKWKRISSLGLIATMTMGLVACSGNEDGVKEEAESEKSLKVGMVTDAGTIDDKSFNQGTWEGIKEYKQDYPSTKIQYVQPKEESTQSFLEAIDNLVLAGNELIITPGFSFEEAIGQAQQTYPQVKFVLIDGQPMVGVDEEDQPVYQTASNTVSISFCEQQAGFLAGVATALETETGKVGFLGGVKVPAVEKLGWGFVAGIAYANAHLDTSVEVVEYVYQGTFTDVDAGKTIAGGMYDKGIDIIMHAAGGVGVGAINEAKTRAENGERVFIVGVDVDQYDEGLIRDGSSVILTSAMKYLSTAAYNQIALYAEDLFPGGETIVMDAKLNGVGLSQENPNLSKETMLKVNEIFGLIQSGEIKVPDSVEALESYLIEQNSVFKGIEY